MSAAGLDLRISSLKLLSILEIIYLIGLVFSFDWFVHLIGLLIGWLVIVAERLLNCLFRKMLFWLFA